MTRRVVTHSEYETAAVGRDLAAALAPGSVVLLFGDLGSGKTAFVRGLGDGLGVDPADVSSPTFTLLQHYRGRRVSLLHVDLYRIEEAREIDELGIHELGADCVVAIEWAEKLSGGAFADAVRVTIQDEGGDTRTIVIQAPDGDLTRIGSSALPS